MILHTVFMMFVDFKKWFREYVVRQLASNTTRVLGLHPLYLLHHAA